MGAPRGLGDLVHGALSAMGVHAVMGSPCGGCQQRREALNDIMPLADEQAKES